MRFVTVPLIVVLCVFLQLLINYTFKKKFDVHENGILLITGTSSGIGRHAALQLAKEGYHVFCTVRTKESLLDLTKEGKSLNLESSLHPIIMDIQNQSHIDGIYLTIISFMNDTQLPFAGIINNAGVSYLSPLESMKENKLREVIGINFIGTAILTSKFLDLIRQEKSRILFVSGVNGFMTRYAQSVYSASKHALEILVDSLRLEMLHFNVSVTSILPGCITPSPKTMKNPSDRIDLPEEMVPIYGEKMKKMYKIMKNRIDSCSSPSVMGDTILQALRDPYPQTRYYVGDTGPVPIWLWRFFRNFLTDRIYDLVREWELVYT